MNLRTIDLRKLNSITKYPSIPTYHALDERGVLTEQVAVDFGGEPVFVTEKVDGTNARIIFTSGGWLIGSREQLLTAQGDLLFDPAQGIVEALRPLAESVGDYTGVGLRGVTVVYGEVYGGKINAAREYTASGRVGFRVFDVAVFDDIAGLMEKDLTQISSWRERGGQPFWPVEKLDLMRGSRNDFDLVPHIGEVPMLPTSIAGAASWLKELATTTRAGLDEGHSGAAEGVVVRTADRRKIAKLRHQDYARAMKGRKSMTSEATK